MRYSLVKSISAASQRGGLPACRVAGSPGCRVAGLPGCRVAGLPGCRVAGPPGPPELAGLQGWRAGEAAGLASWQGRPGRPSWQGHQPRRRSSRFSASMPRAYTSR